MGKKHTYKRRDARLRELLETALGQYQNGQKEFTTSKMAKWTGLAYSSKLKGMLEQLVEEGWFEKEEKIHRNSRMKDGNQLVIIKHVYNFTPEALNSVAII
jgi:hypothetical protein